MNHLKPLGRVLMGVFLSLCVFLMMGEALARIIKLDTVMIKPLLRDMPLNPFNYQPSPNLNLLYELKPNTKHVYDDLFKGQVVEVNALGFRDPPRSKEKDPRCLRIICLGASTVFGQNVGNDGTYPHYLELLLNEKFKGSNVRVEVWNAGIAGTVLRQTVEIAKRVTENYSPDVLIFFYTNQWGRSMLASHPFDQFFRQDPSLFWENARFVPYGNTAAGKLLFDHSYFWRSLVISLNYIMTIRGNNDAFLDEEKNLSALSNFCEGHRDKIPIFIIPHGGVRWRIPRLQSMGIKTIDLFDPKNLPAHCTPEYFDLHPPADVYRWYAQVIARELEASGALKLPRDGR